MPRNESTATAGGDVTREARRQRHHEEDAARLAKAEARAAKAEGELRAMKDQAVRAETQRRATSETVKHKTAPSKLAASMQFNQDCVLQ